MQSLSNNGIGNQYAASIVRLSNQIRRVFNIMTDNFGVQTWILTFVLDAYPNREIYQKDIEEELNIKSSSVSVLLKKMEKEKFITREKVPGDDRLKRIIPTDYTIEKAEQLNDSIRILGKHLTAGIEKQELNGFFAVLQRMKENMAGMEKGNNTGEEGK